jgi:hypothetical protein
MKPINEYTLQECLELLIHKGTLLGGEKATLIGKTPPFHLIDANGVREIANRIHELTRWIPVEERMPTEEDVMNTNDDIHSYMNGLVLWLVAHESGRLDYVLSKWYMPPSTYNKLLAWRRIDKPEGK